MPDKNTHSVLGEIYREHGIKGFCKFYSYMSSDANYHSDCEYVLQNSEGKIIKTHIISCQQHGRYFLIQFDCFKQREEIIPWRKAKLWIHKKDQKDDDTTLDFEGFSVYTPDQHKIGLIKGVVHNPLAQFLVEHDNKNILIPVVEDWFVAFNPEEKKLVLDLPEGLLDQ